MKGRRLAAGLAAAGAAWCAVAPDALGDDRGIGAALPASVRHHIVREALLGANSRRVDIVMIGDSNQVYNSAGWHDGWTVALGERWFMYATPIFGLGENNAIGMSMNTQPLVPAQYLLNSAPAELKEYCDPQTGPDICSYAYLNEGRTVLPGTQGGMELDVAGTLWWRNSFNHFFAMRMHYTYGTFVAERPGRFQPQFTQPGTFNVIGDPIDPATGEWGLAKGFLDVPAGARNSNDIVFRWFGTSGFGGFGPFYGLYMRVERPDLAFGFSPHTLYGTGGASTRDCCETLYSASDQHLITFLEHARALQPEEEKSVIVRIALGGNDFSETEPSVGLVGGFPGGSPESVRDNMLAIIARIRGVWAQAGWGDEGPIFLLAANHPKTSEPGGFGAREALAQIAREDPRVAFVNLAALTTPQEMSASGWYDGAGSSHLTRAGYEELSRREVAELLHVPGDINRDGEVDTGDLGVLISQFGRPEIESDVNSDGIVNTADLGALLANFGQTQQ